MSDSDDSSIETRSVDSYFSSTDSSSSQCPTPRRLLDLIADKFKFMKCSKSKDPAVAASAEQEAAHGNHDSDLQPHQLAVLLRKKLEQLNTDSEGDYDEAKRSPKKVSFQDLPSCSGTQPTKVDDLIDLVLPSTSQAVSVLPSSSKGAANGDKLQEEEDKSIFLLNFPDIDTIFDSGAVKENYEEKLAQEEKIDGGQCESIEGSARGDEASLSKMANGQIRLYDTGRITISFGKNVFELARDPRSIQEEVIRVEVDEETQTTTMTPLGMARGYLDVLPQKVEDTEIDEECMDVDYKKKDEPDEVGE